MQLPRQGAARSGSCRGAQGHRRTAGKHGIPIGKDDAGALVCLSCKGKKSARIEEAIEKNLKYPVQSSSKSSANKLELVAVADAHTMALDDLQRDEVFNRDNIPAWLAYADLDHVPADEVVLRDRGVPDGAGAGFCNAYGTGLTDMNMGYNDGKITLFILAAWAGKDNGVIAGLVGCGLVKQLVLISADLMSFSALPKHCLQLCAGFFAFAVVANLARDFLPRRLALFVPLPMAMAVLFLVGASFAIDMCVGSLVVFEQN